MQGVYLLVLMVKLYVVVLVLSVGVIICNISFFDFGWWQLSGLEKCYCDWKKWGYGYLNVIKVFEEFVDIYFYQVVYDMGIDCFLEWMSKFGYGYYIGIDFFEECFGNMLICEWKFKCFKKFWYQGDIILVGIGQGYWIVMLIQMNKVLMILINDGVVKVFYLLQSIVEDGKFVFWVQFYELLVGDIYFGYWEIVKDGMYGVVNCGNGIVYKYFVSVLYKIVVKLGIVQVFGLKVNEIYNVYWIFECLCDYKLMMVFVFYNNLQVVVVMILENGGVGLVVGMIMCQIFDYIMLGDNNIMLLSENLVVIVGED